MEFVRKLMNVRGNGIEFLADVGAAVLIEERGFTGALNVEFADEQSEALADVVV